MICMCEKIWIDLDYDRYRQEVYVDFLDKDRYRYIDIDIDIHTHIHTAELKKTK